MAVDFGSYVVLKAWSPTFRASFRQQRGSSNAQLGCSCAEAGTTTSHNTAQSWFESRELHWQEAGFDDEGGGRLSVDGRGKYGLNSP